MRKWLLVSVLVLTSISMLGQGEGNTIVLKFAGVPAGTCSFIMLGLNSSNGDLYDCPAGAWVKTGTGGGGGAVTSVSGDGTVITNAASVGAVTLTIAGTSGGVPYFNSATSWASSGVLTANILIKGGGAGGAPAPSLVTDSGTTLTYTGTGGLTTNGTGNQHTITQGTITTSAPFITSTKTWNAAGVAFTDQISNITCTAAATASIAAGWGTAGTQWQLKYGAANCASPQLLSPDGTTSLPSYSFASSTNSGMALDTSTSLSFLVAGTRTAFMRSNAPIGLSLNGNNLSGVATIATNTNCAATGTAANPSVASCTAAAAGSFSCATNASAGTCTVNTTAVTANSEIFVTGRNDTTTGTRLGVTCNTGITTAIPEISAVIAGTSFTINLGTFTTNPECFSYLIIN